MIQTSNVDFINQFALQSLCIDNENIRKRILDNKQIQVTSVPCLLIIFPDGGIEKYDSSHAFEWVEGIIRQFSPPPPPPPPQQSEEEQWRIQQALKQQQLLAQKEAEANAKANKRAQIKEENRQKYLEQTGEYEEDDPPPRRRRVKKQRKPSGVTSIEDLDDLPSDEDDENASDRYRSLRPVGRIRTDEGNYEADEELFQGTPPNMRKARRSAIKATDAKTQKSVDIMAKAKELAKGREASNPGPPPGHPAGRMD